MCTSSIRVVRKSDEKEFHLPCGKCPLCVKAKILSWLFRLQQHSAHQNNFYFITLTYRTNELIYYQSHEPSLHKPDLQKWFKRLRKLQNKRFPNYPRITYYAVGEYGKRKGRPHYHILLFNLALPELVEKTWGLGRVDVQIPKYAFKSITYTLKYISKPRLKYKGKQREFSLMSKGIGKEYLTPQIVDYHLRTPKNTHATLVGGGKIPLPKYYKELLFNEEQRQNVTNYLHERITLQKEAKIYKLMSKYNISREKALIELENREQAIKFDKRNDVL